MDLSIIIVNHNAWEYLRRCLTSIAENPPNIGYEIIVINNHPQGGSVWQVKSRFKEVRLIENAVNAGFARAVNQGIRQSQGKYLLCLNNDTAVLPSSLNRLLHFMDTHSEAIAAGGKVLNQDGSLQFSCRGFPGFLTALFNRGSLLTRIFKNNPFSREYLMSNWDHAQARPVDWVSACYLIMRREAIDKIGLFDERFFMYCEDVDWCFRAKRQGLNIYYFPGAPIIHFNKGYADSFVSKILAHHKSMFYYYKKHLSKNLLMDGVVLMAVIFRMGFVLLQELLKRALPGMKKRAADMPPLKGIP